ncbi:glutamine amidotransferase-related protein, partial [Lysinibacillus fusiformis]|uniref:glutamine amidotransferase-related protein n=1 Tax=Lysinibacillus fusiformis TaxID=28031 RepID=UPI003B96A708
EVVVTADESVLDAADALLLPVVGAFPDARKRLAETKIDRYLQTAQSENRPRLGICLGMQLLFEQIEEVTPTQ